MKDGYRTKSHCKFIIKLHVVFVTKYRKEILTGELDTKIRKIIQEISEMKDSLFRIDVMESDNNHIHMLLDIDPNISVTSIVRRIKQISSFRIWKEYEVFLRKFYWKEKNILE